MTQPRVPAGSGLRGGQFSTITHSESSSKLSADDADDALATRVAELRGRAQQVSDRMLNDNPDDNLATALGRLRALASEWSEQEVQLITAEYFAYALCEGDDPEELAAEIEDSAPGMLLGLDIDEYGAWEGPDRPGEADNYGYDWRAIALELSDRWDTKADRLAREIARFEVRHVSDTAAVA